MTARKLPETHPTALIWEVGTAYEFFVSLHVLHEPDFFDLRPSWAAKIRSRIPTTERTFLEEVYYFLNFPLAWLYKLPEPKNAISVIYSLQQTPPAERGTALLSLNRGLKPESQSLLKIAEHRTWDKDDLAVLTPLMCKKNEAGRVHDEGALIKYLNWWARPEDFGNMLLSSLQAYQLAFFEQEEQRVGPVLQAGIEHARQLADHLTVSELISKLSQGVSYEEPIGKELILVPTFWMTPLVQLERISEDKQIFLFGARPSTMSAIPGELVPEGLLIALKALADPTRLKILNYLSKEELTPSELSRRLNLRAPTVVHHLKELRLAGLVNLTLRGQEKFYGARLEALDSTHIDLKRFLVNPPEAGKDTRS
ncbi:MAG TPA: metalloregulator ArsR/SmtB family transcription factor [Anaerolineales bacterium]|nr:metalloregulator ArsR/SmtB family transcription factor [Anaerolineales bacterium]